MGVLAECFILDHIGSLDAGMRGVMGDDIRLTVENLVFIGMVGVSSSGVRWDHQVLGAWLQLIGIGVDLIMILIRFALDKSLNGGSTCCVILSLQAQSIYWGKAGLSYKSISLDINLVAHGIEYTSKGLSERWIARLIGCYCKTVNEYAMYSYNTLSHLHSPL